MSLNFGKTALLTSENFGKIALLTSELAAFERLKNQ